jgi:hypothetical protein
MILFNFNLFSLEWCPKVQLGLFFITLESALFNAKYSEGPGLFLTGDVSLLSLIALPILHLGED